VGTTSRRRLPRRLRRPGRVVDSAGAYNADRLRRRRDLAHHLRASAGSGLERLQQLVVETINELLDELQKRTGIELYEIHEVTSPATRR
jgi:hypothetical protein